MARPKVLIDTTPLLTASGRRGIGRLTYDVLVSLSQARALWERDLEILAISTLSLDGVAVVDDDLLRVAAANRTKKETVGASSHWARRLGLGRAMRTTAAALVHLPELIGVPLLADVPFSATCYDCIRLAYPTHYLGLLVQPPDGYVASSLGARVHRLREARRWSRARRIVTISERTTRDVIQHFAIDPRRIDLVRAGVDITQWTPGPANEPPPAKPYVLYVGDADYRKNVSGMFDALALARRDADIQMIWAGGMTESVRRRLTERANQAGVGDAVRFVGYVDDGKLLALYRGAIALLFLSRLEGFGLPAVEAMAAGCPVIVAENSGTDDLVANAAVTVSADHPAQAAERIRRLLRDDAFRNATIAHGLAQAIAFDRAGMAMGYVASFRRSLA